EHAAFAVTHIAGRRSLERRDRVRLLELRHVDRDEIALAAIEQIGNGECRLRLADAARTHEHEDALGLVRIFNARTRGANALADERERVRLADEAPPQMILQLEHRA